MCVILLMCNINESNIIIIINVCNIINDNDNIINVCIIIINIIND